MRNISLVDETFDINITESYHLSVVVDEKGISFVIMDTVRKKYIALKHITFEKSASTSLGEQISRLFRTDNYLSKPYKTTGLVYNTPNVTIVPNSIFDKSRREKLYNFSNKLPISHEILDENIPCIDATVIFAIPSEVKDSLAAVNSNNFDILNQSCAFIENAFRKAKSKPEEHTVKARIYHNFFELAILHNNKLELYNTFKYRAIEDLIFYTLYAYEQFELNPEKVSLNLSGDIEKDTEFAEKIIQFLPSVKFDKLSRNFTYSYTLGQIDQHRFTNLIDIYPCV
jgi:hypothetical protein